MQRKTKRNLISRILCMMLIVAMALFTTGCNKADEKETPKTGQGENNTPGDSASGVTELGEGKVSFNFSVVDKDGNETKFLVHTDKEKVGDALLELGLIDGDAGDYGLYVKKVNGIIADYDTNKTYWAFYINGDYAMSGVDVTDITDGDSYTFKVEK